jgi:D-xylose transport system substrate-binding protein
MIKGSPSDPNANFLRGGQQEVLMYCIERWHGRRRCCGVVAALSANGIKDIPMSRQDGDHVALNRVALGTQTVSVWKNAATVAVSLANGKTVSGARS